MVDIELAKAFIDASYDFLGLEIGLQTNRGPVSENSVQGTSQEVNVLIGVTGVVSGTIVYGMSLTAAKTIAGMMLMKQSETFDRNAQSAICEMGNMISGMAISRFEEPFSNVALTPPSLIVGKNIFISVLKLGSIHSSLATEIGNIDVTIALEEHVLRKAS